MSNIRRRLHKLEARLTDSSGLIPNSQAWLDYWLPKVTRIIAAEDHDTSERIPIAVIDAVIAAGEKHDGAGAR
jgi:hypothetical protein